MRVGKHEVRKMKWTNFKGHCDWPIPKWGCLIGGGYIANLY